MTRKGDKDGKPVFSITRTAKPNDADKLCAVRAFDGDEKDGVWSVAFSPDGKRVLKGGGTHVVLYDRATGENVVSIRHGCWSAVTSPDGKQILTATHAGTLHLWNAATGEQLKLNAPQLGRVRNAVFSPNGKLFASSHADGFVHVWDPATSSYVLPATPVSFSRFCSVTSWAWVDSTRPAAFWPPSGSGAAAVCLGSLLDTFPSLASDCTVTNAADPVLLQDR
jgi:WD40 repeat protein